MSSLDVVPDAHTDAPATTPAHFDAKNFPVIAAHFFGLVVNPRSNDVVATDKEAA